MVSKIFTGGSSGKALSLDLVLEPRHVVFPRTHHSAKRDVRHTQHAPSTLPHLKKAKTQPKATCPGVSGTRNTSSPVRSRRRRHSNTCPARTQRHHHRRRRRRRRRHTETRWAGKGGRQTDVPSHHISNIKHQSSDEPPRQGDESKTNTKGGNQQTLCIRREEK